jgi:predicted N-acyltransferase
MDSITIPMKLLKEVGLTINEYLILYNIANENYISNEFQFDLKQLVNLESKGFIKLTSEGVFLRNKSDVFFSIERDPFAEWLSIYPIKVKKSGSGATRALSPTGPDTILGKKLRKKWNEIFKKNILAQEKAIKVLRLQVKQMKETGDLEWMVEAFKWLNQGYHEKYDYLLNDEQEDRDKYEDEDYM